MNYSFIAISDVHLGWKLFNLPELAQDLKDNLARVVDIAIEKRVTHLFIVGDLYDTNKPSPDLIAFVSDQVMRLKANGIIAAGIAGDHDKPVNNKAWIHLSNLIPINYVDKRFLGFDYCDNSMDNIEKIGQLKQHYKDQVEWIFLHGQVPELFKWCEDKKKLDFKEIDLINNFPSLKGVILGDIHTPIEGSIEDPAMEREPLYIGYCGSLGMIKTDEIGTKKGLLYFDGSKLQRLPFKQDREFIRFNLSDSIIPINWVEKYARFFNAETYKGKKPVFIVEYDRNSKNLLSEIGPLYEVGVVRTSTTRKQAAQDKDEKVNIRSELKTKDRIAKTLEELAPDKEVYNLVYAVVTEDEPKTVLDKFKQTLLSQ